MINRQIWMLSAARAMVSLVVGLSVAAVVQTVAASAAQAASTVGGEIVRSEVLERARDWYVRDNQYDEFDYHNPWLVWDKTHSFQYRTDCSGFVSMAWHLEANPTTAYLPDYAAKISISSLKPGDMLDDVQDGHAVLFEAWEADHVHFSYYSFGSDPIVHVTHASIYDPNLSGWPTSHYGAYRYNKIKEDDATAPQAMVELEGGELNRDGYTDLLAVDSATGKLWLYPGRSTGGAFGARVMIGSGGWNGMHDLAVGKFNSDSYDDLIAVETSTGKLWLYPGLSTGGAFGARVMIGSGGWNGMSHLTGGEFNRDSYTDLIAVETSTAKLWLYPGLSSGAGFGSRVQIGTSWGSMSDLTGGEFNRDSYTDLIAVETSTAKLWLYPGLSTGGAFGARVMIGSGGW